MLISPLSCDTEILERGVLMFVTDTIPASEMESWVRKVAIMSGQKVDWHYNPSNGDIYVRALGDLYKVSEALRELMPEHNSLFTQARHKRFKEWGVC